MADPVIINPTLTLAGQAAAFNASNDGLELKITHVTFGRAHYDPTGNEVALVDPVGSIVPVAGASRPTPYQIRMVSAWREDVGQVGIGEIGFWADDVLVFIWSKSDGTVASYKTDGVTYVLFNDLAFAQVPANSVSFVVDPDESVALAALAAHEGADNAHPQYVLRAKFPDYQGHLWGEVGGTANAITLTLPAIVDLTTYITGNRFSFKALQSNTGATTINIDGVGAVPVLKTGGLALTAGSIIAGGVYDVYYDGANFQLTAGAGFASAEATEEEVLSTSETSESTSWVSVRRLLKALYRKVNVSDKATKAEAEAGTDDTKWVTPLKVFQAIAKVVAQATESAFGWAKIATQAQVTTGTDDATIITPKKLRAAQATQAEAEAGTDNTKTMTPLRALQTALKQMNSIGLAINSAPALTTFEAITPGGNYLALAGGNANPTPGGPPSDRNSQIGVIAITPRSDTTYYLAFENGTSSAARRIWFGQYNVISGVGSIYWSSALTSDQIATQAQVNAGTDDATVVTPKKLRNGFAVSLTANGYIVFPSWLGGIVIQWGTANVSAGPGVKSASFPLAFPNAVWGMVCSGILDNLGATYLGACRASSLAAFEYALNVYASTSGTVSVTSSSNTPGLRWIAIGN